MSIPVVTVGSVIGSLVSGLEQLHGPVTVVRHCAELAELVAACQSGLASAAVVSGNSDELGSSLLGSSLVDSLAFAGVALLVLAEDPDQQARLDKLGVATVHAGCSAAEVAAGISAVVEGCAPAGSAAASGRRALLNFGYADASASVSVGDRPGSEEPDSEEPDSEEPDSEEPDRISSVGETADGFEVLGQATDGQEHRLLAVWGPIGSPGRTTLAVNLAAELAAAGHSVLLIDADTYGASVAAALGLLDESAGIAQACRIAEQGMLDAARLSGIAPEVRFKGGAFRVLTGLTRPDRWPELRVTALAQVLKQAKSLCQITIVDCGFSLEADEEISFDTMAPRRNSATLLALAEADEVIAVGASDSIGIPRFVRALQELESILPGRQVTVVLNKVRAAAAGHRPETALRQAWQRFGPGTEIEYFLPWDPTSLDAALLTGRVLKESAPDSRLRRDLAKIVGADAQRMKKTTVLSTTASRVVSG